MISIYLKEVDGRWFGLACDRDALVATAAGSGRGRVLGNIVRSIPAGVSHQVAEESSEFAERTIAMLAELEAGHEENKRFSLAAGYMPNPLAEVLYAAAAIPVGYVTSYGRIAEASGTEARIVGRIMASNPLYPIVPCHRVVGADFSLVGYAGRKDEPALQAKLARLSREARGCAREIEVQVNRKTLSVFPVEWAIARAGKQGSGTARQAILFDQGADQTALEED
jgi:O-6-methylguanine DNA methyltransferase